MDRFHARRGDTSERRSDNPFPDSVRPTACCSPHYQRAAVADAWAPAPVSTTLAATETAARQPADFPWPDANTPVRGAARHWMDRAPAPAQTRTHTGSARAAAHGLAPRSVARSLGTPPAKRRMILPLGSVPSTRGP